MHAWCGHVCIVVLVFGVCQCQHIMMPTERFSLSQSMKRILSKHIEPKPTKSLVTLVHHRLPNKSCFQLNKMKFSLLSSCRTIQGTWTWPPCPSKTDGSRRGRMLTSSIWTNMEWIWMDWCISDHIYHSYTVFQFILWKYPAMTSCTMDPHFHNFIELMFGRCLQLRFLFSIARMICTLQAWGLGRRIKAQHRMRS